MTSMVDRVEWVKLTASELDSQIRLRQELLRQMVGWLYPSVLRDEIHDLTKLRQELKEPRP